MSWLSEFSGKEPHSNDNFQVININAVSEIIAHGTQKTCTMFKVKHNLQQGCRTQTRRKPRVGHP